MQRSPRLRAGILADGYDATSTIVHPRMQTTITSDATRDDGKEVLIFDGQMQGPLGSLAADTVSSVTDVRNSREALVVGLATLHHDSGAEASSSCISASR
jgi:hypothetical protein